MSSKVTAKEVSDAYDGFEGRLYELMMGELLHIGGLASSLELAERAGIGSGTRGIDLCCGNGASMRMLLQQVGVVSMTGIDLSAMQIERTLERTREAGLEDRIEASQGDATATSMPEGGADFVWSEDAWCYVPDKAALVAEAIRLVKPGGTLALTDWTQGEAPLSDAERELFFAVMKFPGLWSAGDYRQALEGGGCEIVEVVDTGRFASVFGIYHDMFEQQFGWDVLKLVGHQRRVLDVLIEQLAFIRDLGRAGKVTQTRVIAKRAS
jgi:ubiquinone/menaquinone biosynthesis C-methylase UbiE